MRNRLQYFRPLLDYLGLLTWVFGLLMLVPLGARLVFAEQGRAEAPAHAFWAPAALALVLGLIAKRRGQFPALDNRRAMMLCALGWIWISVIGAAPFCLGIGTNFLDAYFETICGFTTTGITMLVGLDDLPISILFWRAFIQWLGGLGILTFFLAVLYSAGSASRLFSAESHKIFSKRPAPGLFHTLRILWLIYGAFTVAIMLALLFAGLSVFDAVAHAMTTLSTGGYSPYDASIGYYEQAGYPRFVLIEYIIIVGMLLGGISFFVHYRVLRGSIRGLWDSLEMRLWWAIVFGSTAIVMLDHFRRFGLDTADLGKIHETFRASLFQVVALVTTAGFATKDIGADYFPATAKQIFLMLMVVGGCVGSTGGGFKVLRIGVLMKMAWRQIDRLIHGPAALHPVVVDGDRVDTEELRRVAGLFFAWVALLAVGGCVTAFLSDHDALAAASGMFSALGNIGPCYISVTDMIALHPVTKAVYIFGMLAGRLEVLPILILFSRRTWR